MIILAPKQRKEISAMGGYNFDPSSTSFGHRPVQGSQYG
jgi:hypothetical protein